MSTRQSALNPNEDIRDMQGSNKSLSNTRKETEKLRIWNNDHKKKLDESVTIIYSKEESE